MNRRDFMHWVSCLPAAGLLGLSAPCLPDEFASVFDAPDHYVECDMSSPNGRIISIPVRIVGADIQRCMEIASKCIDRRVFEFAPRHCLLRSLSWSRGEEPTGAIEVFADPADHIKVIAATTSATDVPEVYRIAIRQCDPCDDVRFVPYTPAWALEKRGRLECSI